MEKVKPGLLTSAQSQRDELIVLPGQTVQLLIPRGYKCRLGLYCLCCEWQLLHGDGWGIRIIIYVDRCDTGTTEDLPEKAI